MIWLRLFYVYGQYQHKNSLLPYLINEAKSGREPVAKNPYCALDFVNVKDICEVIFKLTQLNSLNGDFNLGSGKSYFVGDIVNNIRSKFGFEQLNFDRRKVLDLDFYSDLTKIKSVIKYNPSNIFDDIVDIINL